VSIATPFIDYSGNCGNISSGVGPFAVDEGLVSVEEPFTNVRIFNTNTGKVIKAMVPVVGGKAAVHGDCVIPGVPGTGARIEMNFPDCGGSVTGRVLPTGHTRDTLRLADGQSISVSLVDAANPCVFARAVDLDVDASILPGDIDGDARLSRLLEEIRSRAAEAIGLVEDWRGATERSPAVPKMILVGKTKEYKSSAGSVLATGDMDLVGRAMSMQKAHKAYPVTGTICTGVAASIAGTVVHECTSGDAGRVLRIGHPTGVIRVQIRLSDTPECLRVEHAIVERTARRIMAGHVYVPV
jgi:2-methylaconitate cis-trans-isomerase PrpF